MLGKLPIQNCADVVLRVMVYWTQQCWVNCCTWPQISLPTFTILWWFSDYRESRVLIKSETLTVVIIFVIISNGIIWHPSPGLIFPFLLPSRMSAVMPLWTFLRSEEVSYCCTSNSYLKNSFTFLLVGTFISGLDGSGIKAICSSNSNAIMKPNVSDLL